MTTIRPFRCGVLLHNPGMRAEWMAKGRWLEDAGYATLLLPDHLAGLPGAIPALGFLADATERLRLGTLVLANDFRHPVMLAKDVATLDLLSGGRIELGIGAGWQRREYDQAGISFDPASVRIARLGEALRLLKALFADGVTTFRGDYYTVADLDGAPKPVQRPHPPLLVGGGGERILTLAAQEADIVSIIPRARAEGSGQQAAEWSTATEAATRRKLEWIRQAAGDRFPDLELNAMIYAVVATDDRRAAARQLGERFGLTEDEVIASPNILVGSIAQMVDDLHRRRDEFGISYLTVPEHFMEAFAPVVQQVAGS